MTFDEVLAQVIALLQREGRVSYRALKRRFDLDDEYIEDLKTEIVDAKHLAVDEDGKVLVWLGTGINGETGKRENDEKENKGLVSSVQSLESKDQSPASSPRTLDTRLSDSRPVIPGRARTGGRATPRKGRDVPRAGERTQFREWKTKTKRESDLRHWFGATDRRATAQTGERRCTRGKEHNE